MKRAFGTSDCDCGVDERVGGALRLVARCVAQGTDVSGIDFGGNQLVSQVGVSLACNERRLSEDFLNALASL